MNKKTVEDIDVKDKKVLVRCDFNVPQDEEGNITDNRRIVSSLKTIKYLLEHNAKVILCSHLGRPKGQINEKYSLKPVAKELSRLLGKEVKISKDVVGEDTKRLVSELKSGEAILLENLRFHAEEEKNDKEFAKELASLAEIYVNDAFGTSHRAHASTVGVTEFLPSVAGYLLEKEIVFLSNALENPKRPFVAILGGKKVSDKISVIDRLLDKVDSLIIGGGMAYTFFRAKGYEVGTSICEEDKIELAKNMLKKAEEKHVNLLLPIDIHVAKEFSEDSDDKYVDSTNIPADYMGLDAGPKSVELYKEVLKTAKTVVWNGPLGVFEMDKFATSTNQIAEELSKLEDCITIIGGGDSSAAVEKAGLSDKMTHISTGGGASLELLEGKELPGLVALDDK